MSSNAVVEPVVKADEGDKLSFSDTLASLTGFEEIEIEERFGEPIGQLMNSALSKAGRALIFVVERRAGAKSGDAYKAAMNLRLDAVNTRFFDEDDEEEDEGDEPATAEGKEGAPSD